jgi:hypothetical protein
MEALSSSETSVLTTATLRNIPEYGTLHYTSKFDVRVISGSRNTFGKILYHYRHTGPVVSSESGDMHIII